MATWTTILKLRNILRHDAVLARCRPTLWPRARVSVCLSVRPSVTSRYCMKPASRRIMHTTDPFLIFVTTKCLECAKYRPKNFNYDVQFDIEDC